MAADALNSEVIPFFDSHGIPLLRVLTDRGSEYCGNREHHEYALYLDVENIGHTRTKAKSPRHMRTVQQDVQGRLWRFAGRCIGACEFLRVSDQVLAITASSSHRLWRWLLIDYFVKTGDNTD